MSIKFASLKVKNIIVETEDARTVEFEKPGDGSFDYSPGQYLTLKVQVGDESLRRAYSLCSSPTTDGHLAVTVKRVEKGRVSNFIADSVKPGDTIEVLPPMGNFKVSPDASRAEHYVLIGGGSGITPLMSILKSVLATEKDSKVTLLYGNHHEGSIIFKSELERLQDQYGDRLRVTHYLSSASDSWTGIRGQITRHALLAVVQDLLSADSLKKSYWMCGPAGLMEETQAALGFIGIAKNDIHRESFTAPLPSENEDKGSTVVGKRGDYSITVELDGSQKDVTVKESQTILEAVIGEGMDPPYACQMGVCCTCRALVKSGQVEMEEDEGLSDQEIEDGYVLTCQAHPLSADVVLEYM